jgi:hypothetical protein
VPQGRPAPRPRRGGPARSAARRDDILGFDIDVLASAKYARDRAEANGGIIAFIAELDGKRILFAADAHSRCSSRACRPTARSSATRTRRRSRG